uniref:Uncharacterized protein n=1 Tax=mine drainage metagenome TaxID=410659 RepID=E6QUP0_9ZZZZ
MNDCFLFCWKRDVKPRTTTMQIYVKSGPELKGHLHSKIGCLNFQASGIRSVLCKIRLASPLIPMRRPVQIKVEADDCRCLC